MEDNVKLIVNGIDKILNNATYMVDTKEMLCYVLSKYNLKFESIKPYAEEYIVYKNRTFNECCHAPVIDDEINDDYVTCLVCDCKWDCQECYKVIFDNNYLWSSHRCAFRGECNHTVFTTQKCNICNKTYTYHRVTV